MGRTNPTYRDYLVEFEETFADYRRGLRRDEKPHFDGLLDQARAHADAAHMVGYRDPDVVLLLSVCLAHERRLSRLEGEGIEDERIEGERIEGDGIEDERIEDERIEGERSEGDGIESERIEGERSEGEGIEDERIEGERSEDEHIEDERIEEDPWDGPAES